MTDRELEEKIAAEIRSYEEILTEPELRSYQILNDLLATRDPQATRKVIEELRKITPKEIREYARRVFLESPSWEMGASVPTTKKACLEVLRASLPAR